MSQLLNGLVLGAIYTLLALGLSIIWGMMNVVNFAHGIFYALGAYITYVLLSTLGHFWLGLIIAPLVVGVTGMILEHYLLKPLYRLDVLYTILLTFGVALVAKETVIIFFGPIGKTVTTPPLFRGFVDLGVVLFPRYRLFLFGVAVLIIFVIWYFVEKTRLGSIIRAGIEDAEMVSCLGINIAQVLTWTFGLGTAVAALSGVLIAPMRNVEPYMGELILGISFAVVIIGGLGNITGAIFSGFLVGLLQSLTVVFWPSMAQVVIFLFMVLVLLVRPHGLFGIQR